MNIIQCALQHFVTRQRYKSFDGGRRDVSLYNATKIKVSPGNVVMEKRLYKADRKIQWFPGERSAQTRAWMVLL